MRSRLAVLAALAFSLGLPLGAQESETEEAAPDIWSNQADVGVVAARGNSRSESISFDNQLRAQWSDARFDVRFGMYRQRSADITRFAVGTEDDFSTNELSEQQLDQFRLYVNSSYRRDISPTFFWTAGGSWERDLDAGIKNRFVTFAGVGNTWFAREDLQFSTEYTFAYEYRDDQIEDPELGKSRPSLRLAWDYSNHLFDRSTTVLTNNMDFFFNVQKSSAYRFVNLTALTMGMSDLLSLRTSLEFRYDNLPGLETVDLWNADPNVDPNADVIGMVDIRKEKLDTLVKLTLVFNL